VNQRHLGGKTLLPSSFYYEFLRVLVTGASYSVRAFIILRPGDGLTSFSKDNSAYFFGEKEVQ